MVYDRVEWQYVEGVRALSRLTAMLARACELASIPIRKGSAQGCQGWGVTDAPFWVGVYFEEPETLVYQCNRVEPAVLQVLSDHGWQRIATGHHAKVLDLGSEAIHFLAREKESQLQVINDFVSHAYREGKALVP